LLWGTAYLREHLGFPQKAQKICRRSNAASKIGFSKKKSTVLPAKYSAFLVENSGIEPLTSCMPCKPNHLETHPQKSVCEWVRFSVDTPNSVEK